MSAALLAPDPLSLYQHTLTPPLVSFEPISPDLLNRCLTAWGHRMGELHRPMALPVCHALLHQGEVVAVTAASTLTPAEITGEGVLLTRQNTVELSRLCACRPHLCRAALRLWREFYLPQSGYRYAVSYQHEGWHDGATYRFDSWKVLCRTRSGTDRRSGRTGYSKTVWYWDTAWSHLPVAGKEQTP